MSNLASYRKQCKYTQEQLALLSGVSVKTIRALEQGQRSIDETKISTLAAIGNVLKIDCRLLCQDLRFYDIDISN